jgi:hypothetical protein
VATVSFGFLCEVLVDSNSFSNPSSSTYRMPLLRTDQSTASFDCTLFTIFFQYSHCAKDCLLDKSPCTVGFEAISESCASCVLGVPAVSDLHIWYDSSPVWGRLEDGADTSASIQDDGLASDRGAP